MALLNPRGGERWSGEQEIRWQTSGSASQGGMVDIELSRDGGQSWTPLTSNLGQASSYLWNTRTLPNGVYFVRLTLRTEQITSTVTSEPLTLDNLGRNAPVVSLLSPRGGETWWGTREVRWRATDPDGDPLTVSVSYSVDRGATWTPMAFPSSNTGSYIWDTTSVPNADEVWLRATASDGQSTVEDISDGSLAIYNHRAPIVALLSPVGGEQWAGARRISWLATRAGNRPATGGRADLCECGQDMANARRGFARPRESYLGYLCAAQPEPGPGAGTSHRRRTHSYRYGPQPVILRNHSQPGIPFFLP